MTRTPSRTLNRPSAVAPLPSSDSLPNRQPVRSLPLKRLTNPGSSPAVAVEQARSSGARRKVRRTLIGGRSKGEGAGRAAGPRGFVDRAVTSLRLGGHALPVVGAEG